MSPRVRTYTWLVRESTANNVEYGRTGVLVTPGSWAAEAEGMATPTQTAATTHPIARHSQALTPFTRFDGNARMSDFPWLASNNSRWRHHKRVRQAGHSNPCQSTKLGT